MTVEAGSASDDLASAGSASDDLASLWEWLTDEDEFRGLVRQVVSPPTRGTLGAGLEGLEIALTAASTGLASVLVAWVKTRVGGVRVALTRPDGASVELAVTAVRGLDADGVRQQVDQLAGFLAGGPPPVGPPPVGPPPGGEGAGRVPSGGPARQDEVADPGEPDGSAAGG